MKTIRVLAIALGASGLLIAGVGTASAQTSTCSGGIIAAGEYGTLVVTGPCELPDAGTVNVHASLTVTSTGALNGVKLSTLNVQGNVFVRAGGVLELGCSEELGCSGPSHDRIGQSVRATNALAVILHNDTIGGSVVVSGGGGGLTCAPRAVLQGSPAYVDVEDSVIGQSVTIAYVKSCWLGVIRNTVHGNVSIHDNTFADPDATEVFSNTISQSLICSNNSPAANAGDSGAPNVVGGHKLGECASL
jgi:hypothetical protein